MTSLIASAAQVRLDGQLRDTWSQYRLRDTDWQVECWRLYDFIPELHSAASYVGSACSRVRLYVAELDEYGRIGKEATEDQIQAVADTLFGGPSSKAEALRSIGIDLTVAGECFIVGRSPRGDGLTERDRWMVVAPSELRRYGGKMLLDVGYGAREELDPSRDIIIRLWTPHPRRIALADSATRASLAILREIEQLTRYIFAQLDSRLAGAGLLPLPQGMDFPSGDDNPGGAEGLMQALTEAAEASLTGKGSAAALVPIIVEIPPEAMAHIPEKPITFESVLSDQAKALREEAIGRLATGMDMPPEALTGMGDTNHFNAWHIEESAVKIHIEPLVNRICDGLTLAYLRPALKALGVKDPEKYVLWFDTAPLTVRPNRLQDTLNLYERGIVSAAAVRRAGDYSDTVDAPSEEEDKIRFIKELMLRDPTLFQVPAMREAVSIDDIDTTVPEQNALPGDVTEPGPPPPPKPTRAIEGDAASGNDAGRTVTEPGAAKTGSTPILASAELVGLPSPALVAADLVVLRALELAGNRMLTATLRGQLGDTPKHLIHTKVRVRDAGHLAKVTDRTGDQWNAVFADLGTDPDHMVQTLKQYIETLLLRSMAHDRTLLRSALIHAGVPGVD